MSRLLYIIGHYSQFYCTSGLSPIAIKPFTLIGFYVILLPIIIVTILLDIFCFPI